MERDSFKVAEKILAPEKESEERRKLWSLCLVNRDENKFENTKLDISCFRNTIGCLLITLNHSLVSITPFTYKTTGMMLFAWIHGGNLFAFFPGHSFQILIWPGSTLHD